MNDRTPLTPREIRIRSVAAALHGSFDGSLEALAARLRIDLDALQAYCGGKRAIPLEFSKALHALLGSTRPHDPAWRREEWVLGHGPPDGFDRHRTYLFHLWPPRFRARLVQIDPDTGKPVLAEQHADIESGIVCAAGGEYVRAEIEWSDKSPAGPVLVELCEAASNGLRDLTQTGDDS